MLLRVLTAIIYATFSAGCTQSHPPDAARAAAQAALLQDCPMSIYEVYSTGNPAKSPLIRPEHISSITPAPVNHSGEAAAMLVRLTPEGERIMLRFSQSAVGEDIAVFCEADEISRARIFSPVVNDLRIVIPASPGGT